jgi:predicted glycosyltransferase involved in capsule biosynthesis
MSNFTAMVEYFKINRVAENIAKAWISAVYFLSQNGNIDLKIYDPLKAKKMIAEKEKITGNPVKKAISNVGMIAKSLKTVAIVGGIAVGLFYINNITKVLKTVKSKG